MSVLEKEGGGAEAARGAAHRDRNLTEGSVRKNLWTLSWPQMVEGALNSLDQTADLFWVGHAVGFRAIGGLGRSPVLLRGSS